MILAFHYSTFLVIESNPENYLHLNVNKIVIF